MNTITILFADHPEDYYVHEKTLFIMRGGSLDGHGYFITHQQKATDAIINGLLHVTPHSTFVQHLDRVETLSFRRKHDVVINVYWEIAPVQIDSTT